MTHDGQAPIPFSQLTTLEVGGAPQSLTVADSAAAIVETVDRADTNGENLLILGGGSNVVVSDDGWPGPAMLVRSTGVATAEACGATELTVAAGEPWDEFVASTIGQGLSGLEALSGIPGLVGATPIQNVGAYGQEVAGTIVRLTAWDRKAHKTVTIHSEDCGFSYRHSRFKAVPDGFVILSVTFGLARTDMSAPIRYAELAATLGVGIGDRAPADQTRAAVLRLRASKGMVLDPRDPDTRSAGSFFTNPILSPEQAAELPEDAPRFAVAASPTPSGDTPAGVKTSAAWLIENAGFTKGYGMGPARLSSKHTLALTNHDAATTQDVLNLGREVQSGVEDKFGIRLEPEPVLIGCRL